MWHPLEDRRMKIAAACALIAIALAWSHFVYYEAGKQMLPGLAIKVWLPAAISLLPIGAAIWVVLA